MLSDAHEQTASTNIDLSAVDLNLLVALDALLTEESVTRAAERLSIGQSAMSSTLARLRKVFDDELLARRGRGVVATPLALSLKQPVREVLLEFESILARRSTFDPLSDSRTFRIMSNDYFTHTFLRPLIERLGSEAPGIKLHITQTDDDFDERLRNHRADLVFLPDGAWDGIGDYPHRVLLTDRYLVAAHKDHPDVGDTLTLEQFTTLPYLATASGRNRSVGDVQLDELGIPRNIECTTGFGPAPFMLQDTRLIMLIHRRMYDFIKDVAGLKGFEVPVDGLRPLKMLMAWRPLTDHDPAHRWLRGRMIELARDLE